MREVSRGCGRAVGAAMVCAVAACSGPVQSSVAPDFVVDGLGVKLDTQAIAWTRDADFPARLERTVGAAARYFGGGFADLRGWTVVFTDSMNDCPTGDAACAYSDMHAMYVTDHHSSADGPPALCVEASQVVHEVGHAILGDPCHTDPRWQDFISLERELEAMDPSTTAFIPAGTPCLDVTAVLDWRRAAGCH